MKRTLTFSAFPLFALAAAAQDQCSTALPITAGTYTVAAINGSQVPTPVCAGTGTGATAGEWYSYTAPGDFSLTVTTDLPSNSGGDTRLHIYTGTCAALVCLAGDDDSGTGYLAKAIFNVTAGTTYHIAFDDRWSNDGFDFQVIENTPATTTISFTPTTVTAVGYPTCVVDMNGDFLDDIVATGTTNISINHQQAGGGFIHTNITTTPADNSASWSIAAGDIDANGFNDLLYGGGNGVTFMVANSGGTAFTEVSFPQFVFSQRSNFVDINNDGHLDAFVCHDVAPNVYYINDGSGNLSFNQGGLGPNGGNYGSIWTDYDNDHDLDMFVAKCGSSPPDILMRNNNDGTFTDVAPALGFADGHQAWSSAWGDFDNDGDMDVMVGTSSSGYHKLMRNDLGSFANVTAGSGFDTFAGQSIEWTTHDFNNDGWLDILGGGAMMMNNGNMTFTPETSVPTNGPIGDLNNDGFLDIVNGTTVFMNDGNGNHWLKVNTIGTASNRNGIGARVTITSAMGTQIRDVKSGDGFSDMSSLTTHFGIGDDTSIDQVTVHWPSGIVNTVLNPSIDGTLEILEDATTSVSEAGPVPGLGLVPVPARDMLTITGTSTAGARVRVMDDTGREVLNTAASQGMINVASLKTGIYLLAIEVDGRILRKSFAKE